MHPGPTLTQDMIGHKLGEFSVTKRCVALLFLVFNGVEIVGWLKQPGVYNTSLSSFTPSSPSASPYAFPYSGIGRSTNRGPDNALNSQIVRSGLVSMKEDSFANWLFQRKWLVLREQMLSIHKNKVRLLTYLNVLPLLTVLR